ncbi:hypothetical protein BDR26DRAFT_852392 [Obelidium mucronatum]|nr:hypothetical protein BDR26DRAFT_852392 [Obelidium mucronatum]
MMSHPIWYRLVHPDHSALPNTESSKVMPMPAWDVDDFKTAVWNKNESLLKPQQVVASGLKVFKNEASLSAKEALAVNESLQGLGCLSLDPVVVVVPARARDDSNGTAELPKTGVVFECSSRLLFTQSDLGLNGIFMMPEDCPHIRMDSFKVTLEKRRSWKYQLQYLENTRLIWDIEADTGDSLFESDQEINQYYTISLNQKGTLPSHLSELALAAVVVAPVVDESFARAATSGYNRNKEFYFPLNFKARDGDVPFHLKPVSDISVRGLENAFYWLLGEEKIHLDTANAFFSTDTVKLAYHHDQFSCPFLIASETFFDLFIFYKNGDSRFAYQRAYRYDRCLAYDMCLLAFHLRNLPREHLAEVDGVLAANVVKPTKDSIWEEVGLGYKHYSPDMIWSHCIPNANSRFPTFCLDKNWIHWNLLESDGGIYLIVFRQFTPLEDVYGSVPCLSSVTWQSLIIQLEQYVEFLSENRFCHRDLKPKNLAIDSTTNRLVVLDCDLMAEFPKKDDEVVYSFVGTKEYADPAYFERPERGFNVFDLELYSLNKTCDWMRRQIRSSL